MSIDRYGKSFQRHQHARDDRSREEPLPDALAAAPMTGAGQTSSGLRTGQVLHGVFVHGDLKIPGAPVDACDGDGFFVETSTDQLHPTGKVLAARRWNGGGYCVRRKGSIVWVTFEGWADFRVDLHRRNITASPRSEAAISQLAILFAGNVLAVILGLEGEPVLHSSAVQVGTKAIAFVGDSGAGKSTCAALLCARGGRLVTDDTARLSDLAVHRGPCQVRLRPGAARLAPDSSLTADGRLGLTTARADAIVPLGAVVFPTWTAGDGLRQLDRREAFRRLLRFPRIGGWRDPTATRAHFHACAEIARRLPVAELHLNGFNLTPEVEALI